MRLKHLLSVFLTLLTLSVGQMWATDPSVSVTSGSFATSGTIGSIFPYTIVQNSGSNAPYTTSGNLRMYYQTNGNGRAISSLSPSQMVTRLRVLLSQRHLGTLQP